MPETAAKEKKPRFRIKPWLPIAWLLLMAFLYAFRLDFTHALTLWPAWVGMMPGLILTAMSLKWRVYLFAAWAVFGFLLVDEFRTVPRGMLPVGPHDFRVVSLNCAGGSIEAAREVKALNPDLVLLQESPTEPEVAKLAYELFGNQGHFIAGVDASIIAKGQLDIVIPARLNSDFVFGIWKQGDGHELKVISLRFVPPTLRFDLYDPAAWREFSSNRATRWREASELMESVKREGIAVDLMGGDFNSPPDPALAPISNSLGDVFREAGVGLGATCVNPMPCIVRIDQMYHSASVRPVRAWVVKTVNSDHRMLAADFTWSQPPAR